MTQFVTTAAGDAAASVATPTGPFIEIVEFRVGSDFSTAATALDTGLAGTTLYTGVPDGYVSLDSNTIGIRLVLPATAGPFEFGEIGLYLPGGVLYARCSFGSLQQKLVSTVASVPSVWRITAALRLSQAPALFNIATQSQNLILEAANYSLISTPAGTPGSPNAVIVHEDTPYGQSPMLWKTTSNRWALSKYNKILDATLTGVTAGSISAVEFASLAGSLPNEIVLEMASGELRAVSGIAGTTATLTQSISGPVIGDLVRVHQAQAPAFVPPRLTGAEYNSLVNDFNVLWSTPSSSFTQDATGWNQTAVPTVALASSPVWTGFISLVDNAAEMLGIPNAISATGLQSDWSTGFVSNQLKYNQLVGLVSQIKNSKSGEVDPRQVSATSSGVSVLRSTVWQQIHHDVSVLFATANEADSFFNAGGYVGFDFDVLSDNMSQSIQKTVLAELGVVAIRSLDSRSLGGRVIRYSEGNGTSTAVGNNGYQGLTGSRRKIWSHHVAVGSQPGTAATEGIISLEVYATQVSLTNFNLEFWITDNLGVAYSNVVNGPARSIESQIILGQPSTSLLVSPPITLPTISTLPSTIW